jgi:large subunit ribosomal protein L35
MPKMKTKKSVACRFRVTATGKLKRGRPGKGHILTKKTAKRKMKLNKPAYVAVTIEQTYKRLMCV